MNVETLTEFFFWCTVVDGGILILWTLMFLAAPNMVYRTQRAFVNIPRETFDLVMYGFIGGFKMLFLVFNVAPLVALLIMR